MRASDNTGFTLIELLMVIAIFAIGSAIALPNLMEMGRQDQVKTEARQLKDQMARARAQAIEENNPVVITFAANNYTIGGTIINLTHSTIGSGITDSSDNPLAAFQWDQRGYPTSVGGTIGDLNQIEINITNTTKSLDILVSTSGNISISQH